MKIRGIRAKKSDIIELNENILTINGKPYDLDNLLSPSTEENAGNIQFFKDNQCYTDNGIIYINLNVDIYHHFMFINNNDLIFYDKDLNGDIDKSELAGMLEVYNMTEDDRRASREKFKDSFTAEQWKERVKACQK